MDFVSIREYLLSLPDSFNSYKVKIEYYFSYPCANRFCTRVDEVFDEEYSPSFDSLQDVKKMIIENSGYYYNYSFIFDDCYLDVKKDVKISDSCICITYEEESLQDFPCSCCGAYFLTKEAYLDFYYGDYDETADKNEKTGE